MRNGDPGPLPPIATRCNHCGVASAKELKSGTFSPPVPEIGQPLDAAYFFYATRLSEHLARKHPEVFNQATGLRQYMLTRLLHVFYLNEFTSSDPELMKYRDVSRHSVLRALQLRVSDQKLEERVNSVPAFDGIEGVTDLVRRSDVLALVKEMRAALQEDGLYPEFDQAEQNRVVLASPSVV